MNRRNIHWYKVEVFPLELNLSALLIQLQQQSILHRVTEEPSGQCLWVNDPKLAGQVRAFVQSADFETLIKNHQAPTSDLPASGKVELQDKLLQLLSLFDRYTVTLLAVFMGIVGALLVELDTSLRWLPYLTFQPLLINGDTVSFLSASEGWKAGQWWRLITPALLHFGLFHILFNGLWVWEFGRRIEFVFGSRYLLALMLVLAAFSNLVQYLSSGPSFFGGLSGVLYGLLGFLWIFNRRHPHPALTMAPGIIGFMLIWLVLGMTGTINVFIDGSIANGAHFGGLVAGMAFGFFMSRHRLKK